MSLSPRSLSIEVQSSTLGVHWFSGGMTGSSLKVTPPFQWHFAANTLQTYCVTADLAKLGTTVGPNINDIILAGVASI